MQQRINIPNHFFVYTTILSLICGVGFAVLLHCFIEK